jgi:hypothetical protein
MSGAKYWGWSDSVLDFADVAVERQRIAHEELVESAKALLALKDGPRDEAYEAAKPAAWERLRRALEC